MTLSQTTVAGELWHRSVVKSGVRVSQVKPSNCFRLHPTSIWFPNTQQFPLLTACRRLENFFDTSLSSLRMWNLQSYPTTFLKECHILGWGSNILWPLVHIFRGSRHPTSQDQRPTTDVISYVVTDMPLMMACQRMAQTVLLVTGHWSKGALVRRLWCRNTLPRSSPYRGAAKQTLLSL